MVEDESNCGYGNEGDLYISLYCGDKVKVAGEFWRNREYFSYFCFGSWLLGAFLWLLSLFIWRICPSSSCLVLGIMSAGLIRVMSGVNFIHFSSWTVVGHGSVGFL